jgi:hypothetical protein
MSVRNVYLAVYRLTPRQRAHFAIFIPNSDSKGQDLSTQFKSITCKGTIIQVVGEPLMAGYQLEIKRNYDCKDYRDLDKLVHLGHVDISSVFDPKDDIFLSDDSPRAPIERVASQIIPPQRGQNIRAPIDGVGDSKAFGTLRSFWADSYL